MHGGSRIMNIAILGRSQLFDFVTYVTGHLETFHESHLNYKDITEGLYCILKASCVKRKLCENINFNLMRLFFN